MAEVHRHEPYAYHAWTVAKNHLIYRVQAANTNMDKARVIEEFFRDHVTEYGQQHHIDGYALEQMDDHSRNQYREWGLRSMVREIAENIFKTGAYTKETRPWEAPPYGEDTIVRVLVMNFGKLMGPAKDSRAQAKP